MNIRSMLEALQRKLVLASLAAAIRIQKRAATLAAHEALAKEGLSHEVIRSVVPENFSHANDTATPKVIRPQNPAHYLALSLERVVSTTLPVYVTGKEEPNSDDLNQAKEITQGAILLARGLVPFADSQTDFPECAAALEALFANASDDTLKSALTTADILRNSLTVIQQTLGHMSVRNGAAMRWRDAAMVEKAIRDGEV